jgi:hypothetical protein
MCNLFKDRVKELQKKSTEKRIDFVEEVVREAKV